MKHLGLVLISAFGCSTAEAKDLKDKPTNPNCALLTLDELKTVLGKTVVPGFEMDHMCVYQLAPAEITMTDQLMVTTALSRDDLSEDAVKRLHNGYRQATQEDANSYGASRHR